MAKIVITSEEKIDLLLQEIKSLKPKEDKVQFPEVMDNATFCKLMRISPRTSQNWRDSGKTKFTQIGKKIYFSRHDVLELISKNKI